MQKALELARRAGDEDEVPVGAVVVHQGRVIGSGWNRREALNDPLGHAELMAISEAARSLGSWRLLDCVLYVTLEPCPMCLSACQQARVSSVIYGTPDPKGGALSLGYRIHEDARTNHRFGVEHRDWEPCRAILKEFFRARRLLP
jgi:tRNA(adenine34) deaminase